MFARFFRDGRLRRVERKLKTLHFKQRDLRTRIEEAEKAARGGDVAAQARLAKLQSERERLAGEVRELTAEEKRLKQAA